MKYQQVTIKCGKYRQAGHNSRSCKHVEDQQVQGAPENINNQGGVQHNEPQSSGTTRVQEPTILNMEGPNEFGSQSSQEAGHDSQHVQNIVNILPPIAECDPYEGTKDSTPIDADVGAGNLSSKLVYKEGPSMWEQVTGTPSNPPALSILQPRVNIRAPPPMRGGNSMPMFSSKSSGGPSNV